MGQHTTGAQGRSCPARPGTRGAASGEACGPREGRAWGLASLKKPTMPLAGLAGLAGLRASLGDHAAARR